MIPFTDTVISNIERIQSQVAKYALGLPSSAANICAQTELGFKPFRLLLYGTQLHYYNRVLSLSNQRWVKQAMDDHMSMHCESPYMKYLLKIRTELGLISLPKDNKLNSALNTFFINKINSREYCLSNLFQGKDILKSVLKVNALPISVTTL